jgi:hypothetical protein
VPHTKVGLNSATAKAQAAGSHKAHLICIVLKDLSPKELNHETPRALSPIMLSSFLGEGLRAP